MSTQAVSYGVDSTPSPVSRSLVDRSALALVLVGVALAFAPTLGFGFVDWDDPDLVVHNALIVPPQSAALVEHLATPQLGYPQPITLLSYRLEHAFVGFSHPWVQHLVNVLFHLGSVALVFSIARRLGVGTLGASLAAVLVGLHPAAAEPVSWVTGRKAILALFFSLATIRLRLSVLAAPNRGMRIAAFATFLLALGSKPVAVALAPIVVLITLAGSESEPSLRKRLRLALSANLPELLATLLLIPLAYVCHRMFGGLREHEPFGDILRSAWYGLGAHLAIFLGIEAPCVEHIPAAMPPPYTPRFDLLPPLVGLALAGIALSLDTRSRKLFAAVLAGSVFAYLPSSGLVPMNRFLADSYVYPALPGLGLALGLVADRLLERHARALPLTRRVLVPAFATLLALFLLPASARFRSSEALWYDALQQHPKYFRACQHWSTAVGQTRGPRLGLAATDRCLASFGPDRLERPRAIALFELGRSAEAGDWMARSLDRYPHDRKAPDHLLALAAARLAARDAARGL